jgi:hypothetical protein
LKPPDAFRFGVFVRLLMRRVAGFVFVARRLGAAHVVLFFWIHCLTVLRRPDSAASR